MSDEVKTDLAVTEQAAPIAEIKPNAKVAISGSLLIFVGIFMIGAGVIAAWHEGIIFKSAPAQVPASAISNIVSLDFGGVISASTRQFLEESKINKADAAAKGKEFSNRLATVLNEYKDAGVIIVDQRYVIAAPDGHDITADVMAKLNLKADK